MRLDPSTVTARPRQAPDPEIPGTESGTAAEARSEGPLSVACGDRNRLFGPGVDDFNELDDPC